MKEESRSFSVLIKKIIDIVNDQLNLDKKEKLKAVCKLLREEVPYYDWVGFYLINQAGERELVLGSFDGKPTEHVMIPFGSGICGQAAETRKTFIVQDVSKEKNYLSCSPKVKSEIVVPVFKNGKIVGELDIDSHKLSPFTKEDKSFVKKVCEMVCDLF